MTTPVEPAGSRAASKRRRDDAKAAEARSQQVFLPFSRPCIGEEEVAAVDRVLRSGWITTGKECARFERDFSAYCGARMAVALASATAGMHLLLRALEIGPGDEVITPSMTWVSTVNLIEEAGARPVFVDIDRDTLLTSAAHVAQHITSRTRLVVPVHFAGAALDLEPLCELARGRDLVLAEDGAHAVGTEYRRRRIGAAGTVIFSFHPIKNLTCGEGGMLCTDSPALGRRIRSLRFHGLGVDAHDREMQGRAPQAEVVEPGYKYNLTDMAAALGVVQLGRLERFIEQRALLAHCYRELLAGVEEILPLAVPEQTTRHSWHLFIVRLDVDKAGMSRERFAQELKQRGIGTGYHFKAVHTHGYYRRRYPDAGAALPHTEWNSRRLCSLPLFPAMNTDDVRRVVDAIKEVLAHAQT